MLLLNGNCLELLSDISNNSIDLVILDLPYGQTNADWDNKIDLQLLWKQLKRIGKPNTPFFFFCTTKFGYELIKSNEKWFRYDLVWFKENCNAGFLNAKKMPMRNHELIYVFYNKLPFYNIQEHHTRIANSTSRAKNTSTLYGSNQNLLHSSGRVWQPPLPKSVIRCDANLNRRAQNHSTEKPIGILEWIIKYYSKSGDTILDPTMGSGSTGVACNNLGRNFIGIEFDSNFFQIAYNRCYSSSLSDEPDDTESIDDFELIEEFKLCDDDDDDNDTS